MSIHRVLDCSRHPWAASQQLHTSNVTSCCIAPCMSRLCACSLALPPLVREESISGLPVAVLAVKEQTERLQGLRHNLLCDSEPLRLVRTESLLSANKVPAQ